MARRIKKEDREDFEYEGIMRLVCGIIQHVLDNISISKKWENRNISMSVLLAKKQTLNEMRDWMKGWQWSIWVNIYSEHNNYDNHLIKRRFKLIREQSTKDVNKRIKNKIEKNKAQNASKISI